MFFTYLTFAAALFIEGLGSLVSVIGISALFGANPIIIALAIALDVGKVVVVSLLYTYWRKLTALMKTYALLAATVTMVITSAGAAGYLSGEFQKAIMDTKEGELKVGVLKEQQAKYQDRKKQIDDQIANLPQKTSVGQRLRLINGFKAEQQELDRKISAIDEELPNAQIKQIGTEAKAGPILYIAKALDIPVERAVSYVIGLIIFVFDPLAIFLIIAGNFLWAHHRKPRVDPVPAVEVKEEPPPRWLTEPDMNKMSGVYETKPDSGPPLHIQPETPKFVMEKSDDAMFARGPEVEEKVEPPPPPILEPEPTPIINPEPEPEPVEEVPPQVVVPEPIVSPVKSRATYRPSGLLSPVNVEHVPIELEPIEIQQPQIPLETPVEEVVEVEEVPRSSLGSVQPDPATIVNAHRDDTFTAPRSAPPPKK